MSLILEALKKSETERRIGELPGLMTPAGARRGRRSSVWPILLAVLLLVAVVTGGLWWLLRADRPVIDPAPAAATAPSADPAAIVDGASGQPSLQREIQRRRAAAVAAATTATPAVDDRDPAKRPTTERESPPQQPSRLPPPPTPLPRPDEAPPASTAGIVDPADADTGAVAPDTGRTPPATADATPAATAAPSSPTAGDAADEGLPSLRQLPAATRDRLPPLKISMYVYNEGPASRFLLVDGRRAREGDRIADGLVLIEVRRQQAVLEFEGERFLLPRP